MAGRAGHGAVWPGWVRQARQGAVRLGTARHVEAGKEWQGMSRMGKAWLGQASQGSQGVSV